MNALEKIQKIQNAIDLFDDAEFVSVLSEDSVLVRNSKNNSTWTINYYFENDEVVFNSVGAEKISAGSSEDVISEDGNENFASAVKQFLLSDSVVMEDVEDDSEMVISEELQQVIASVRNIHFAKNKKELISEDLSAALNKRNTLSDEQISAVDEFVGKYSNQITESRKLEQEFLSNGKLFTEDQSIRESDAIVSPAVFINSYKEKMKIKELIAEHSEAIKGFYSVIAEEFDSNIVEALQGIHLAKDISVEITKKLIAEDIRASEARRISNRVQEIYSESLHDIDDLKVALENYDGTQTVDNGSGLRYLTFNQNIFNRNAVATILEDFDKVIAKFQHGNFSQNDFNEVVGLRTIVENMLLTNTIDDEQVGKVLFYFNTKYGKPSNTLQSVKPAVVSVTPGTV